MITQPTVPAGTSSLDDPRCEKDHALWLEEIAVWKREHARALEMLEETAEFIRRHDAEFDEHLREIETHSDLHRRRLGPIAAVREKHLEVRRRHNIFQGRHRGLMDEVTKLRVTLHKAAHGRVFG